MFGVEIAPWLEAALLCVMVASLLMLAAERQLQSIRMVTLQGAILGSMPVLASIGHLTPLVIGTGVVFFLIKAVALPYALTRTHNNLPPQPPSSPYLGHKSCILLGLAGFAFSIWLGEQLAITGNPLFTAFFPPAFGTMFAGLLLIICRRTALNQVIGYLVLENGIYLLGVPLTGHDAIWIELSTLLDICVAVFVMGIAINRISRAFDSTDIDQMSLLKD